jgi:AraC-like DNA-binding protein
MPASDVAAMHVAAYLPRQKPRTWARRLPLRRGARLTTSRTPNEFADLFRRELVDAALVDLGAGEDAQRAATLALEYPSVAFFSITSMRPSDAPALAHCAEVGFADVIVEGTDDVAARDLILRHAYTARFAGALATPPRPLALHSPLQLDAWRFLTARAGRPVQTSALATALGLTREHLSRSFGTDGAPTLKRLIDLVRLLSAAELAKNPGYDVADVARVLGFSSAAHLSLTVQRLIGRRASSLAAMRGVDVVERFAREEGKSGSRRGRGRGDLTRRQVL